MWASKKEVLLITYPAMEMANLYLEALTCLMVVVMLRAYLLWMTVERCILRANGLEHKKIAGADEDGALYTLKVD